MWLKNGVLKIALSLLAILVLLTTIFSIFTYGQKILDSDSSIAYLFADAVWNNHSYFPKEWSYANGDIWTIYPLVAPLSVLIHPFVSNAVIARLLVSAIQLCMSFSVIVVVSKKILRDDSWTIIFPLTSIFVFGVKYYILYDACYGDFAIWQVLTCVIIYRIISVNRKQGIKIAVPSMMVLFLLCVRGPRSIVDFTIPIILTLLLVAYRDNDNNSLFCVIKKYIFVISGIVVSSGIGIVVYRYLSLHRNINNVYESSYVFPDTVNDIFIGLLGAVESLFELFGYKSSADIFSIQGFSNFVSLIMCSIVCFIVPVLQYKKIRNETKFVQFTYFYAMVHFLIFLICNILLTFVTKYHMISSVLIVSFVSGRYIYNYWIKGGKKDNQLWVLLFFISTIIQIVGLVSEADGYKESVKSKYSIISALEEHNLNHGYATFWNAYITQLYSDNIVKMGAIRMGQDLFTQQWWLSDSNVFSGDASRSFIMLTEEEYAYSENNNKLIYDLIEPVDEFVIENVKMNNQIDGEYITNVYVFVYDDDYAKYMTNGIQDGVVTPNEMYFNYIGDKNAEFVLLGNGGIVYGPYSPISKGNYLVTYIGSNLANQDIDITSDEQAEEVEYQIVSQNDNMIVVNLTVNQLIDAIQFRLINNNDNESVLQKIVIERIS